ncbi:MAG: FeoC-like transcriptional regulator [Anaerolineae bacterium]|nr:FeoC-like transcriptional regulator [Anaerolineae bacterium]
MTQLREVLTAFENTTMPLSVKALARQLRVEPGLLDGMIQFWVQKGRLRVVESHCGSCGMKHGCNMVGTPPKLYELVGSDAPPSACCPTCHPQKN